MRDVLTTCLDTLGLLLLAAGAYAAVAPYIGPSALGVSGVVVLAGSAVAERQARPAKAPPT